MDFLEVGKIINTHGLKGEVKAVTWTDSPDDFEKIKHMTVKRRSAEEQLDVEGIKYQKNNIIIKFAQIKSIEQAEMYKNAVLLAKREELGELPEGVYYIADLIGCEVFDKQGEKIGDLTEVFSTGSNDVYEIKRTGRKTLYVPIIDGVKDSVDIENKRIVITIPEGLEE